MDRTTKQIFDFYNQSPVNKQRYMFSLAMLGDVRPDSMRELSQRFQHIKQDDPEKVTRGFRDMRLDADPNVSTGMRQALHDIKQTSKGVGSTMRIDGMFANHFSLANVSGAIAPVLGGKAIHALNDSLDTDDTPEMKMKRANSSDDSDSSDHQSTEEKPQRQKETQPEASARPENDMNQTNVRRHTEEESEVDNQLARDKKRRRQVQQRMRQQKQPHM